jgi:hypothetical protein
MGRPEWTPTTMTAEQLNHELVSIACSNSMGKPSWEGRAQYLGIRLQRSVASYRQRFGLEIVRNSHTKSNRYRFASTEEQLSLLRAKEPAEPAQVESEPELERQEEMF